MGISQTLSSLMPSASYSQKFSQTPQQAPTFRKVPENLGIRFPCALHLLDLNVSTKKKKKSLWDQPWASPLGWLGMRQGGEGPRLPTPIPTRLGTGGCQGIEPELPEGLDHPFTPWHQLRELGLERGGAEERQTRPFCDHRSSKLVFPESFWDTRFPSSWKVGANRFKYRLYTSPNLPTYEMHFPFFF